MWLFLWLFTFIISFVSTIYIATSKQDICIGEALAIFAGSIIPVGNLIILCILIVSIHEDEIHEFFSKTIIKKR